MLAAYLSICSSFSSVAVTKHSEQKHLEVCGGRCLFIWPVLTDHIPSLREVRKGTQAGTEVEAWRNVASWLVH